MSYGQPIINLFYHLIRGSGLEPIDLNEVVKILERLGYIKTFADKRNGKERQFYKWLVSYKIRSKKAFKVELLGRLKSESI